MNEPMSIHDLTIIVRTCGERTFNLCKNICRDIVGDNNLATIDNIRPFSLALKKSYEKGLDFRNKWTLMVDADVILDKNSINSLIQLAEILNPFVCLHGFCLDKFFRKYRFVGCHLYPTYLLPIILKIFNSLDFTTAKRPETLVKRNMEKIGYPMLNSSIVIGIHDYEQYYRDIWCKGFYHSLKHSRKSIEITINKFGNQFIDQDYTVFFDGVKYALSQILKEDKMSIIHDKSQIENYSKNSILLNVLKEKETPDVYLITNNQMYIHHTISLFGKLSIGINSDKYKLVKTQYYNTFICKAPSLQKINHLWHNSRIVSIIMQYLFKLYAPLKCFITVPQKTILKTLKK